MNKRALFSLPLLGIAATMLSAPISPEGALTRMHEFSAENLALKMKAPSQTEAALVYTAVTEDSASPAFYVFNKADGGFVLLSADDRLPAVLGFSDNGVFDLSKLSPNMKWWLEEYTGQIDRMYRKDGIDTPATVSQLKRASVTERKQIAPMIKTKWDQMAPYNELTPNRYPTGCVATAMAQVMKYYEWPEEPVGSNAGVNFDGTWYEWDLMLDEYKNGAYTMNEALAVATLMRQCGAAVNMQYTPWASGAYSSDVPVALYTYFGYSEDMSLQWRDYHSMSEWNDMVYAELEANRPVYYSGASSAGGHAFVCDGYLGNNFFHFNWGWGGYQDGYFLLNALNPGVGGTGSYAGGYNSSQMILTGVKRYDGPAKRQVAVLSTGSFQYDSAKSEFGVGSDPTGYNMFYNPLSYNVSGSFGLKVTPMEGGEAKYFKGSSFSFSSYYGSKSFTCAVSGLIDGFYKCEPVFIADNVWNPVQIMTGTQRYVTLEVKNGKYSYINQGIPDSDLPSLLSGLPLTMPVSYSDAAKAFRVTVLNVSGGDYNNDLTLSLYEQGRPDGGYVLESTNHVTIPGNAGLDVDFIIDDANVPAVYDLYLTDYQGKHLIAPSSIDNGETVSEYSVQFVASGRDISPDAKMVFRDISPNFWTLGNGGIGLTMTASNDFYAEHEQTFQVRLLSASDFSEVFNFGSYRLKLDTGAETIVNFTETEIDLLPGYYYWQVSDLNNQNLSRLYPLMVVSEPKEQNGVWYQVYSEKDKAARIVAPQLGEYEGKITIPETINGYTVKEIKADALSYASDVTEVNIPSGVGRIENGCFYNATGLKFLGIYRNIPPVLYPSAFAPGARGTIKLDTYSGKTNLFAHSPLYEDFIYSTWNLEFLDGVSYDKSTVELDPYTGQIYNPYYAGYKNSVQIGLVLEDTDYAILAEIDVNGQQSSEKVWRWIKLPVIDGKAGTVRFSKTDASGVAEVEEDTEVTIVRPDGVVLYRKASPEVIGSLPRGLYIINGHKVSL